MKALPSAHPVQEDGVWAVWALACGHHENARVLLRVGARERLQEAIKSPRLDENQKRICVEAMHRLDAVAHEDRPLKRPRTSIK